MLTAVHYQVEVSILPNTQENDCNLLPAGLVLPRRGALAPPRSLVPWGELLTAAWPWQSVLSIGLSCIVLWWL